jgi:hypothetical protein
MIDVQPKLHCALEITKEALHRLPMSLSWFVHKLGQFVYCTGDIRMSDGEVLQSINSAAK